MLSDVAATPPPGRIGHGKATVADYFAHYEPLIHSIRMAAAISSGTVDAPGAIANFLPVVSVPNRAGRNTGRALLPSIEPGEIITEDTAVHVLGEIKSGDASITVDGYFCLTLDREPPEADYVISGDARLAALVEPQLPQSKRLDRLSLTELRIAVCDALRESRRAESALVSQFDAFIDHKMRLVLGYTSATWSTEDARQDMFAELARGIALFASPARPNTSLYSWADLHVWRAVEKSMRQDAGLSGPAWSVRRWLISEGYVPGGHNSVTSSVPELEEWAVASLGVSRQAAEEAVAHFFDLPAQFKQQAEAEAPEDLRAYWTELSRKAGLSLKQSRVCSTRLFGRGGTGGGPLPWREVSSQLGVPQSTCQGLYGTAMKKLRRAGAPDLT